MSPPPQRKLRAKRSGQHVPLQICCSIVRDVVLFSKFGGCKSMQTKKKGDMLPVPPRTILGCNWMFQIWRHMGSFLKAQRGWSSILHSKLRILSRQKGEIVSLLPKVREGEFMLHICKENSYVRSVFRGPHVAKFCCKQHGKRCTQFSNVWGCNSMLQMPIE